MDSANRRKSSTLGLSISKLLRSLGIEKKVLQQRAIVKWPEIVGSTVSRVTTAEKVIDEILFVKVSNSAWRNELIYMKTDLLAKIYSDLRADVIKDIRFI